MIFFRFARVLGFILLAVSVASAQDNDENLVIPPNSNYQVTGVYQHASLIGWALRSEMQMMNRSSNPYGLITDRGWMYNYTNKMFDEYVINQMTFSPTLGDDYMFYRSPNAVRFVAGDYDDLEVQTNSEIRLQVELMPKHIVSVWAFSEHNTVLNRGFMNFSYQYQFNENLKAGFRHTFGSSKMDLDVSLFGQFGNEQTGYVKADIALMDYLNDYTKDRVSTYNYISDTLRNYTILPVKFQVSAVSPTWKNLRGEFHGAYQTESDAIILSAYNRDDRYKYTHGGYFFGGLVEYAFPYVTLGSVYQYMYSSQARDTSGRFVKLNYTAEQTEIRQGFYTIVNASQVTWDSWFWLVNYEEIQDGKEFGSVAEIDRKFKHDEVRVLMHNRLILRPDYKGITIGFEHLADLRKKKISVPNMSENEIIPIGLDPMNVAFPHAFHTNNNRIVLTLGYQYHPRAWIQIGYAFDLDLDYHRVIGGERYDTAYLRMEYRW